MAKVTIKKIVLSLLGPVFCAVIVGIYFIGSDILRPWVIDMRINFLESYVSGTVKLILGILGILVLSLLLNGNGFKHCFSPKGYKKALFTFVPCYLIYLKLLSPLILLALFPSAIQIAQANFEHLRMALPSRIFFEISNSIFEEVVIRALLLVTLLYFWGNSYVGRICIAIFGGVVFALLHDWNFFILYTSIGFLFCAAYIYSKNILVLIVVHTFSNMITFISNSITVTSGDYDVIIMAVLRNTGLGIYYILFPLFGLIACIKAAPFSNEINLRFNVRSEGEIN